MFDERSDALSVSQEIFTTFCNPASAEALQKTAKA